MQRENLEVLLHIRPWVRVDGTGTPFLGPKLQDLLVAYYITQGENEKRAKQFAKDHIDGIYAKL